MDRAQEKAPSRPVVEEAEHVRECRLHDQLCVDQVVQHLGLDLGQPGGIVLKSGVCREEPDHPGKDGAFGYWSGRRTLRTDRYRMTRYDEGEPRMELFDRHNLLLVLQGHLHVDEMIRWRGTTFITGGAVCGKWWRGAWHGTREGFGTVTLRRGRVEWEYHSYGWQARRP